MRLLRHRPRPDDVEEVAAVFALEQCSQLCAEHLVQVERSHVNPWRRSGPGDLHFDRHERKEALVAYAVVICRLATGRGRRKLA